MNKSQQALLDELSNEELEAFYIRDEQRLFDKVAKEAEFWGGVENMTPQEVINFHESQLKAHKKNQIRAQRIDTKVEHNRDILVLEGLLIVLRGGN